MKETFSVKFVRPFGWSIWGGEKLLEGGFSSRAAAEDYFYKEYCDAGRN